MTEQAPPPAAIRFDATEVRYAGDAEPAVDGVSLAIQHGELVVLLGPSGCGKTTLLKTVNRLVEPTGGRVLVGGQDVRQVSATRLRRRIGFAIQATGLFPHMRVSQNIAVVPRLLEWSEDRIMARVSELLDLVGLPQGYSTRWPRQLSGGEAQRVGIARALAADPQLLLMDEPFGALDAITRGRLQEAVIDIQEQLGKTILFVTHDVDEALRLADRVVVLRAGKVVQVARPLTLLAQPSNDFVADLVGAADAMRRLRLMTVADALRARPEAPSDGPAAPQPDARGTPPGSEGGSPDGPGEARLRVTDHLGTALSRLLDAPAEALPVRDAAGHDVARLRLADLRWAARSSLAHGAEAHGEREPGTEEHGDQANRGGHPGPEGGQQADPPAGGAAERA